MNITDMRQVIFKLQSDYDDKGDELSDAINMLFPVGQTVVLERGGNFWPCTIMGESYSGCEYLTVTHDRTGKSHSAHYGKLERR